MRRRRLVVIVCLAGLAAVGLSAAAWLAWSQTQGRTFDPEVWRTDLDAKEGARVAMARRLLRESTLHGKTRQELVELLGEPQPVGKLGPNHLVYWLALRGNQSDWLILRLGPDGRVTEAWIDRE